MEYISLVVVIGAVGFIMMNVVGKLLGLTVTNLVRGKERELEEEREENEKWLRSIGMRVPKR